MTDAAPAANAAPATPATPISAEPNAPGKIATMTPEDYRSTLLGSHGKEAKREDAAGKEKEAAAQKAAEGDAQKAKADQAFPDLAKEKYELELPPNALLDKTAVEEVVAFARAHGLPPKAAQAVLERENELAARYNAQVEAHKPGGIEWNKKLDGYELALSKDPEVGRNESERGDTLKAAKEALLRWFDPSVIKMLNETGEGSNPAIVKALAKIGRASRNDTFIRGSVAPPPKDGRPRSIEDMYLPKKQEIA